MTALPEVYLGRFEKVVYGSTYNLQVLSTSLKKFYDNSGEKARALKSEAEKLARRAKAAMKAAETLSEAGEKASKLKSQADNLKADAETLKEAAWLEDLTMWVMEMVKPTKKGNRSYHYWMATWRAGGKMRNVHLGNCGKMVEETAKQKARSMKDAALAIKF
jgi:hypothetical protein